MKLYQDDDIAMKSKCVLKYIRYIKSLYRRIFFFLDCVDNYNSDVFRFNECTGNDTLKCDNGKCFNLTSITDGSLADCSYNETQL